QVANGTDAANASSDARHLSQWSAFVHALEITELGDVEMGIAHLPDIVELHRDFGMALDARYRIDEDALRHGWLPPITEFDVAPFEVRRFTLQHGFQHVADALGRSRAAGHEVINCDHSMHGHHALQQAQYHVSLAGDLRMNVGQLHIAALQDRQR